MGGLRLSYQQIYSDIESKRGQIKSARSTLQSQQQQVSSQKKQLHKPVVSGSAKQKRIAMRRIRPTREYKQFVAERGRQRSALEQASGEIGTARKELSQSEQDLSEYESKVKEAESTGFKVRETDSGFEFYKTQEVSSGGGSRGSGDFSVRVTWKTSSGETKTFRGSASGLNRYYDQIHSRGGQVITIESLGGGRQYRDERSTITETGFTLPQFVPTYTYKTVEIPTESKKIGDLTVSHIGMDKQLDLGFGKQDRSIKTSSDSGGIENKVDRLFAKKGVKVTGGKHEKEFMVPEGYVLKVNKKTGLKYYKKK